MKFVSIFFIILLTLSSCRFEENVQFKKIREVRVTSVEEGKLNLTGEAQFYNPNDVSGKLKSIDLQVLLNDRVLAEVSQDEQIKIGKQAEFVVPFAASFGMEEIQQGFLDNLMSIVAGRKLKFHFKGKIKVSTWGFTQTVPVDYFEEVKLKF